MLYLPVRTGRLQVTQTSVYAALLRGRALALHGLLGDSKDTGFTGCLSKPSAASDENLGKASSANLLEWEQSLPPFVR